MRLATSRVPLVNKDCSKHENIAFYIQIWQNISMNTAEGVTRREVLKSLMVGAGVAIAPQILAGDSGPAKEVSALPLEHALGSYTDTPLSTAPLDQRVYPHERSVAIPSNDRLRNLRKSKFAFAVVHAGFIEGQLSLVRQNLEARHVRTIESDFSRLTMELADGRLGNIAEHEARLARLIAGLGETAHTLISFVDEPDAYNPATPGPNLAPPQNALQIITQAESPDLARDISFIASNGEMETQKQQPHLLYEGLKDAGVDTIYIAGEYTFNPWSQRPACLGGVALQFMEAGFDVRGIHNAVFPPTPQAGVDTDSRLAEDLYNRAIPYSEAVYLART